MAFPTSWIQTWMEWPTDDPLLNPYGLQWWQTVPPYDPTGDFTITTLFDQFADWYYNAFGALISYPHITTVPMLRIYIQTPTLLHRYGWFKTGQFWHVGPSLPQSQAVVIRKHTAGSGRSSVGRMYVPCIPPGDTKGGALTKSAFDDWTFAVSLLLPPITHAGSDFIPSLVSYKLGTITPITKWSVRGQLGLVHRRAQLASHRRVIPFAPKAPPP